LVNEMTFGPSFPAEDSGLQSTQNYHQPAQLVPLENCQMQHNVVALYVDWGIPWQQGQSDRIAVQGGAPPDRTARDGCSRCP
jgi:hypothetical protein